MPDRHVRETVEVVVQQEHVEIWLRGSCIARHVRYHEPSKVAYMINRCYRLPGANTMGKMGCPGKRYSKLVVYSGLRGIGGQRSYDDMRN